MSIPILIIIALLLGCMVCSGYRYIFVWALGYGGFVSAILGAFIGTISLIALWEILARASF